MLVRAGDAMKHENLQWSKPILLAEIKDSTVPTAPGVYAFTEYYGDLQPNAPILHQTHPGYQVAAERSRAALCILYIGQAANLGKRLLGYLFREPREGANYRADRHKG